MQPRLGPETEEEAWEEIQAMERIIGEGAGQMQDLPLCSSPLLLERPEMTAPRAGNPLRLDVPAWHESAQIA